MWDFSTDPDFEAKLEWARAFVRDAVEPLEVLFPGQYFLPLDETRRRIIDPLKEQVRAQGLWACHLGPDLGGQGYGAVKLALLNEILGRTYWASIVFGTQAPDTGNAEILARFGTPEQRARYLVPLLNGEIFSCFSMTEPQGGADPGVFLTRAVRDGEEWVITGRKYFSSNAATASFFIVLAVTDPDVPVHRGCSVFLVPRSTPGLEIETIHQVYGMPEAHPGHALVRYEDCRLPADALLGDAGSGFAVAQARLAGGRLHHAMRAVGQAQRALDMMCERALSRTTKGSLLSDKQLVQEVITQSYVELLQFRLTVLYASWLLDEQGESVARSAIAAVKILAPKVLGAIASRSAHIHGALGLTSELPLMGMVVNAMTLGLADGPSEVHSINLAKSVLGQYLPSDEEWPTEARERRLAEAHRRYGDVGGYAPAVSAGA
jgi:alkylation response protein AidB-like acyl-CoA dehydrogenase